MPIKNYSNYTIVIIPTCHFEFAEVCQCLCQNRFENQPLHCCLVPIHLPRSSLLKILSIVPERSEVLLASWILICKMSLFTFFSFALQSHLGIFESTIDFFVWTASQFAEVVYVSMHFSLRLRVNTCSLAARPQPIYHQPKCTLYLKKRR